MSVSRRESRLVGGAAVAFAVSLFVYLLLVDVPDLSTTGAETSSYYGVAGHRTQAIVAAYLAALTAFLFVVFVVGSVRMLQRRAARSAAVAGLVGGTAFVALFLAAAALFAAPAFTLSLNNEPVALDGDFAMVARTTSVVGDAVLLMFVPFAVAVFVVALTVGNRGTGGWPRWLTLLSWVVAAALVTPLVFFSLLLLVIWCVTVGVRGFTGARDRGLPGGLAPPHPASTSATGPSA